MDKKTLKTFFICAAGTLLIAFALYHYKDVLALLGVVLHAFRPVLIGIALGFVLNRPYQRLKQFYSWVSRKKIGPKLNCVLSLITLYLLLFGIITGIILFVIPQIGASISTFVANLNGYYENIRDFAEKAMNFGGHNWWEELQIEQKLLQFAEELPNILQNLFSAIVGFTSGLIGTVTDCVIGLVISIYGLAQKDRLAAQSNRLLKSFLPAKYYERLHEFLTVFYKTFSMFVSGQITEACILGVLCFFGMTLFGFDYAILISVIAAISNLIPLVGPIIGTIPSAFILFMVKPSQAFWFILFMIVLQQLESNLIYPKVVGGSVGLPAIWVLISVVVAGSLFGILGMFLAIPVVSVAYEFVRRYVNRKNPPHESEKKETGTKKFFWSK